MSAPTPARRARRTAACDECKRRKVKCSTEPQCSNCTRDRKNCIYSAPIYRVSALQRSLDRHELFIENVKRAWAQHVPSITLEQALLDLEQQDQGAQPPNTESPTSVTGGTGWTVHSEPETSQVSYTGNTEYSNAEDFEFDESDDFNEAIDGMGFLTVGPRKSGYTGPQSGLAAVKFLRSLPSEGQAEYEDTAPGESPGDSISSMEPELNTVNIDEVINDYFTLFHTAYPLLHEGLFRARMAGVAPKPRDGSWPLLYNMVITMGAFVGDSENTNFDLGFYRRARECVSLSVLGKGSLCYVQALVLMANYLQKRNKPNAGFALIGIAWSMALSIGLHREFGNFSTSPFIMEQRRRTWWVLFIFVSGAQLTFGRPPVSLIGVNIHRPTNLEDSSLAVDMEALPPARNGPTVTSCLIAQIQLAIIANSVQTELLSNKTPDIGRAQHLDGQITAWLNGLPSYLQEGSQLPTRLERPKYVLLWRSHHLRIVLHRPFLFLALAKIPQFSIQDQSVQTCISTADACVDSIHAYLRYNPHCKRGFAWYATYWLLSASFVHATCLAYKPADTSALQWKFRLERSLEALQILAPAQGVAVRAQRLLSNLVDRFNRVTSTTTTGGSWDTESTSNILNSSGAHDFASNSELPLYHNFNLEGDAANLLEGNAADLFWLWPQDINADFMNTGDEPAPWNEFSQHDI
ncbi:hypothetical protein Q7P37_000602 [Cladosporium fusiforme]